MRKALIAALLCLTIALCCYGCDSGDINDTTTNTTGSSRAATDTSDGIDDGMDASAGVESDGIGANASDAKDTTDLDTSNALTSSFADTDATDVTASPTPGNPTSGEHSATPAPEMTAKEREDMVKGAVVRFSELVRNGDFQSAFNMYDSEFASAAGFSADTIRDNYQPVASPLGEFVKDGITKTVARPAASAGQPGEFFNFVHMDFENGGLVMVVVSNDDGKILDAIVSAAPLMTQHSASDLPPGVMESNLIVQENSAYPLNAKLTYHEDSLGGDPVPLFVLIPPPVLIQGMDYGTEYGDMYKALAYELAGVGFAALRYDSWTFSYMISSEVSYASSGVPINLESIDAAVAAIDSARTARPTGLSFKATYAVGHKYSGMLIPRIVEAGGYDGGVIMNATPLPLVDLLFEINKTYSGEPEYQKMVQEEYDRAYGIAQISDSSLYDLRYIGLEKLDDEQILSVSYFSFPALYLKKFYDKPTKDYFAGLTTPLLILCAGRESEIPGKIGYDAYDALIKETGKQELVTLINYPEANGYFAVNGSNAESETAGPFTFNKDVITAIKEWATRQ